MFFTDTELMNNESKIPEVSAPEQECYQFQKCFGYTCG